MSSGTHRFVARRSAYFWLGAALWTFAGGYGAIAALVGSIPVYLLPVCTAALATIMLLIVLAARSGVAIHDDGSVHITDGWRTFDADGSEVREFVIVDSVAWIAAPLLLLGTGPFAPDRLGVDWRDGTTTKLQWSFANHDDIRIIRKELNRRLRRHGSPNANPDASSAAGA